ncbi:MAG: YopX family protein [Candidatus Zixiibacteriota bacterium]
MKTDKPPRAWHKKLKQMFTCHSLEWSGDRLSWVVLSDRRGFLYKAGDLVDIEEVILLWPTGLRDKNGTEAYQDDIVESGYLRLRILWSNKDGAFVLRHLDGRVSTFGLRELKMFKVIGNVHQHPDLLKKEQP